MEESFLLAKQVTVCGHACWRGSRWKWLKTSVGVILPFENNRFCKLGAMHRILAQLYSRKTDKFSECNGCRIILKEGASAQVF
jgi:uncharacterized protein with PIN domain